MAIFEIEKDGKTYEVDAPSMEAAASAFKSYSPPAGPSTAADVAKSAGIGVAKGVLQLGGAGGDLRELLAGGARTIGEKITGQDQSAIQQGLSSLMRLMPMVGGPTSREAQKTVEGFTGEFYKPQTTAGEYAQTVGEFVPAAVAGPGGIGRRLLSQAVAPALASETAGQLTKGTAVEPYARFGGAVTGAVLPGMMARGLNPLRPSAERRAAGDVLRAEGIPVTAGQETGSTMLKAMENPFGSFNERQLESFTQAVMRRAGEAGGRATRENVDNMFKRLGNEFDGLAARNTATIDRQALADLRAAENEYNILVSQPNRAPAVNTYAEEIASAVRQNRGTIPGEVYQSIRHRIETTARGAPQEVATALRGMREALDDAMERTIAMTNPNDLGAWRQVRNQYRNALVIERAATSGGENVGQGLLTPGKVSQAVTSVHGRRNRARGRGDFSELSDAADTVMTPLPNSGTAPRLIGGSIGGLIGAPFGFSGVGIGAAAGAAAGDIVTAAAIRNPLTQAYLAGRLPGQGLLANPSSTVGRDALVQALLRLPTLQPVPQVQ